MALSHTHISLFCELRRAGVVGRGNTRSILEFGEQNWFGDVHPREIYKLIDEFLEAGEERERVTQELDHLISAPSDSQAPGNTGHVLFDLAKLFYGVVLRHESYTAVDLHGTDAAQRHDLNLPLPIEDKFDLVTNLGTAEHVFNQFQFFCSLHERAKPGGLIIHELPNQGCYDHGFFNYHPTFVFDLCAANGYHIVAFFYVDGSQRPSSLIQLKDRAAYVKLAVEGRLSSYSGLLAVLRKGTDDNSFRMPMQGYYDNALPPDLAEAWRKLPK